MSSNKPDKNAWMHVVNYNFAFSKLYLNVRRWFVRVTADNIEWNNVWTSSNKQDQNANLHANLEFRL